MTINLQELERYKDILKIKKAKITPQRVEILKIFLKEKHEHFTAEDIIKRLGQSKTGQATVYRTLELFSKIGLLKKVNFQGEDFTQYDIVYLDNKHFHHHLVCTSCGTVIEITDDLLESVEEKIQTDYKFKVQNHELVLRGICLRCQSQSRFSEDDESIN